MYANQFFVKKKTSNPITITSVEMEKEFAPLDLWGNLTELIFLSNITNPGKENTFR